MVSRIHPNPDGYGELLVRGLPARYPIAGDRYAAPSAPVPPLAPRRLGQPRKTGRDPLPPGGEHDPPRAAGALALALHSATAPPPGGQALAHALLGRYATLVTPDTILRWYRRLVAQRYDGTAQKAQRGRGSPRKRDELTALVLKIARENPGFGYTRIRDTLHNLGHQLAQSSVARILADHGVEPAPERSRQTSWKAFRSAHWESLAAADCFQVDALTWRGVVRYSVFFVVELKTRRVQVAGIRENADSTWLVQVGRNLLDACEGFLRRKTHLILDRDLLYSAAFKDLLDGAASRS